VKKHIRSILAGVAVVVVLMLYFVTFTVRFQEQALVLTFGKITKVETEPGLKWIWPWQKAVKFDTRIRTYEPVAYEVQTKDKQTVICQLYMNWRIQDAEKFYAVFRRGQAAGQEDVVFNALERVRSWLAEATNVFARYTLGELVTLDREKFKLLEVERGNANGAVGMLQQVREKAAGEKGDHEYGIQIVDVGIRKLGVPDTVTQSVFKRMEEERTAVVRTLEAEGDSEAKSIVGKADGTAAKVKAEAESRAKAIRGEGDAKAAEYYSEFLTNPELANFLRKLDTLRKTLTNRTTIVLDQNSPAYDLLTEGPEKMKK